MMIPTQLCREPGGPCAGLMRAALPAVQRCSMGAGAATRRASTSRSRSCMYARSLREEGEESMGGREA